MAQMLGIRECPLAKGIRIQIDRNDKPGAKGTANRYGHRIDKRPVDKPVIMHPYRVEYAWKGIGGTQILDEIAFAQPDFMAGRKFGGDCDKALT